MKRGRNPWVFATLGLVLHAVNISLAQAGAPPPGWKTECVGYYQLSLPAEVEVALIRAPEDKDATGYQFSDGTTARFSESPVLVTTLQPRGIFEKDARAREKAMREEKKELLAEGKPNAAGTIRFYPQLMPGTLRIDGYSGASVTQYRGGRSYHFSTRNPDSPQLEAYRDLKLPITAKEIAGLNILVDRFLHSFRVRELFEMPPATDSGLCIPYGFIADGDKNQGREGRYIAVTFRLKAHPDVEIYFKDSGNGGWEGASTDERGKPIVLGSQKALDLFWSDVPAQELKLEGGLERGYRPVQLAGWEGVATRVTIIRNNDAVDYGYTAYVQGHKDYRKEDYAKQDTPDLMLYVIRTAAHTKGTPMSKDDLYKLAEQIAASVKRRVTEPPRHPAK